MMTILWQGVDQMNEARLLPLRGSVRSSVVAVR